MGRSSSTASSPSVCGTKLNAYPPVRVATHHYASSETTLADSLPSSPQYQPPPYADEALPWPPEYRDELLEREKRHWEPLPKETLVVRLCTSVFIAFIVCLIVAAVVGRIHDTKTAEAQDAQDAASHSANGTRYTMMADGMSPPSTSTTSGPMSTTTTTMTVAAKGTTTAHGSIARPIGTSAATYSCPYIGSPASSAAASSVAASSATEKSSSPAMDEATCGLTVPLGNASSQPSGGSIVDIELYSLKDCVIARTVYHVSDSTFSYRCSLSCTEEGGPGVDGLVDGWKWRCS